MLRDKRLAICKIMSILNKLKSKKVKTQTNSDIVQTKVESPRSPASGSLQFASSPRQSALFLKQAWVTEKASDLSNLGKYVFIVDRKANKSEVKKAIESIYGVKVKNVNMINIKGKARRLGRTLGRTSSYKKAIVTLKEGQKIEVMPT